ncbi:MAG: N-acyl homoserine lactonase family protein [Firmicutes bacterium]|nr:N-acyl homoserine lactonase family protein [Bacillota bacterium]
MDKLTINALYLGRIKTKKLNLVKTPDKEENLYSPIVAFLIRHPQLGNILYDTGNSDEYAKVYPQEVLDTYAIDEFVSIEDALKKEGLTVNDIDILILSHLHFDHAGGLRYFQGTKAAKHIFVSKAEYDHAFSKDAKNAYVRALYDIPQIYYYQITEDRMLAEDLGLFIQKAHTPGLIGLIVKTQDSGTFIFTGDTVYTRESYERQLPPGGRINKSEEEFFINLEMIKELKEKHNATLIFGHDYVQALELCLKTIH